MRLHHWLRDLRKSRIRRESQRVPKADSRHWRHTEQLEVRTLLAGAGVDVELHTSDSQADELGHSGHSHHSGQGFDAIYDRGTTEEYMGAHPDAILPAADPPPSPGGPLPFQFDDVNRWSTTVTNGGGLGQGDATTLTWSIVPDGTSIPGANGEATSNSTLIAFLGGLYGVTTNNTDLTDEPWFPLFESYLNRWGELSGLSYIYEPSDDGATFSSSPGAIGSRGDIRISGHSVDGQTGSNTLAYNFFPDNGDMVIDTDNTTLFGDTTNNSRAFRNVLAHEHGHGLGVDHVCPIIGGADGRLMEPFINTSFDGPQFDDILAVQRGYGDALEKNGGNDTSGNATDLGTILAGQTVFRGTDGIDNRVAFSETDFVSIDDNSDTDVFSFTFGSGLGLDVLLTPRGPSYLSGVQNPDGSCSAGTLFDASSQSDLTLEILGTDGTTVVATANATGVGAAESISGLELPAGTYFARVTGAANAAQMYELGVTLNQVTGVTITESDGNTTVSESGRTDTYTLELNTVPTGAVEVTVSADSQTEISTDGTNFSSSAILTFTTTTAQTVTTRAINDSDIEGLHTGTISHAITSTADPTNYPTSLAVDDLTVSILDNELTVFERLAPLGGLIFRSDGNTSSLVDNSDHADFEFFAEAGQTISVVAEPTSAVSLTVELVGVSGTITAAAAGDAVVVPPQSITSDGTYTIRVTSDAGSDFTLEAFRNASLERQIGDTADGSELSIGSSFISLGSGRYAVVGTSAAVVGSTLEFTQSNDPAMFIDISATGTEFDLTEGQVANITSTVGNSAFPAGALSISDKGVLTQSANTSPGFRNAPLPTAGTGMGTVVQALFPFWDDLIDDGANPAAIYWEERQVNGINTLIVQWEQIEHFDLSTGAGITFQIQVFETGPVAARFAYEDVNIGSAAINGGRSATIGYQASATEAIQFSFNSNVLSDGDVLDLGFALTPDVDEYTLDLTGKAGHRIDVLLNGLSGADLSGSTFELLDTNGTTVLATGVTDPVSGGTNSTNYDLGILDFVVPADGVYTVRLTATATGDYTVVVSDDLAFDSEPNTTATDPLRLLNNTENAFGYLDAATDQDDFYQVTLSAGELRRISTQTPFDDAASSPQNSLDTELQIIHPDGSTVVANDLNSQDGKNSAVLFNAPVTGIYRIRVRATSGSGEYILKANDPAALTVAIVADSVSEGAGAAATTATVTRNSGTTGNLVVTLSSDDTSEATVPTTVTILDGQASATLNIDAVNDALIDGPQVVTITASGAGHTADDDTLTVTDDEPATLTVVIVAASIAENAGAAATTATVTRNRDLTGALTVNLTSNDTSEATVTSQVTIPAGQTSVTFNIDAEDDDVDDQTQTVTISATATGFTGGTDTVDVTDNDVSGFTIVELDGSTSVDESGTTDTFTVVLNSEPLGDVVLDVVSGNTDEATVSPTTLTFTAANWDTPQTVTISGVDDNIDDGDQNSIVTVSIDKPGTADALYDLLVSQTVMVTTTNDDIAGFTIVESAGSTSVNESGTTDSFTVVLDAQPLGDVVLDVVSGGTDEATVSPATLTFTSANWDTPQTVTVTGVDELVADGPQITIVTISINAAATTDAKFDPLIEQQISASTLDDDVPTLTVTIAENSIGEGDGPNATTGTVTRNTPTVDPLVVLVTSSDQSEATVPQSVTIAAGQTTSAPFPIDAQDELLVDGQQTIEITATTAPIRNSGDAALDTTFGDSGVAPIVFDMDVQPPVGAVEVQPDGKIIIAAEDEHNGSWRVVRLNPDGSLDSTFGNNGVVISQFSTENVFPLPHSIIIQSDGKIVVGGKRGSGTSAGFLARYNADGSPDSAFGVDGIADISSVNGWITDMVQRPDGTLLLAIAFNGSIRLRVAQIDSSGNLVSSFGIGGVLTYSAQNTTSAIHLLDDGRFLLAGGIGQVTVSRSLPDGTLDPSFSGDGIAEVDLGRTFQDVGGLSVTSTGQVVVSGAVTNGTIGNYDYYVTRFTSDGTLDSTFSDDGVAVLDIAGRDDIGGFLSLQADDKVVIVGHSDDVNGDHDLNVIRFDTEGNLDTLFDSDGILTTPAPSNRLKTF
jgi:uncharacterized delta-60 repeat protein